MPPRKKPSRKTPSAIAQKLLDWRRGNGLSIRSALRVLEARRLPDPRGHLPKWLSGERRPSTTSAQALEALLREHPVIDEPPV